MDVVLSVLQIVGWVLLIVLAIALFLVLVILFCPVKYRVEGEWLDEKWAKAKVHWFFHLVRLQVSYGDNLLYGKGGVLWKTFTFFHDFTEKGEEEETIEQVEEQVEEPETETTEEEVKETSESMISKIKGMIERIRDLYPKFKKMVTDERNKAAVAHLKDELVYLIKIVLPKKSKVDAVFSTGSPDTTGQLFGVLACFPITYSKGWSVVPDFQADDPYFRGSFFGKGKIYGYQLAGIVLRIVFDKKCRRLYNIVNRFIKIVKNDNNQEVK